MPRTPIIDHDTAELPVFEPGNLLAGARRQKGLPERRVPAGSLLDMDGELLDRLVASERAALDPTWPCFHTKLYRWKTRDFEVGVVGGTVGAPFAVLVAEELFASGCTDSVARALAGTAAPLRRGASWTTDAPFRETQSLIDERRAEGILCVEMEAAALLAMASASRRAIACLAHVTNAMATRPEDFDKGGHDGQEEALDVCARAIASAVAHVRDAGAGRDGDRP